jgi:DNA-binding response OmpR family regulator
MKAVILSNIFILANQISSTLKKKLDIDSVIVTNPVKKGVNVSNLVLDDDSIVIIDLATEEVREMLSVLKERKGNKKIIVLGNNDSYKDIVEIVKLGVDKYIKKPFQDEVLVRVIKDLISQESTKMERMSKKGFITFARQVSDVWIITILGCLEEGIVEKLRDMKINTKKVVISLNGISVSCMDPSQIDKIITFIKDEGMDARYIVVREKISELLIEKGISEGLIFTNEVLAIKSFSQGG